MRLLLALGLIGIFAFQTVQADAVVGSPAPNFTLTDAGGKQVKLSDYLGKIVVLEWTNVGCPFVKKEYGSGYMPQLQTEALGNGVIWLSICSSAPGKEGNDEKSDPTGQRRMWGAMSTDYLVDGDGTVGHLYGAKTTPHMFIIDKTGTLRYAGAIDSIPSTDPADIKKAEPYFSEALDAVLAGNAIDKPVTTPYGCSVKY